jgi:hypothetical protein
MGAVSVAAVEAASVEAAAVEVASVEAAAVEAASMAGVVAVASLAATTPPGRHQELPQAATTVAVSSETTTL